MKKADRKKLDAALDKALSPPRKIQRQALDALLDEYDHGAQADAPDLGLIVSAPPPPTTSYHLLPPPTTSYQIETNQPESETVPTPAPVPVAVSPERDYAKVANSITRDAVPSGLFRGNSKKLYDALYLRTRGAINSCREIKAKHNDLMEWAGISHNTLRSHIRYLESVHLINVRFDMGDNNGAFYEVRLPEEVAHLHLLPPPTTSYHLLPPPSTQNLVPPSTQNLVGGGRRYEPDFSTTYDTSKTIKKTIQEDDDDTHTLRAPKASLEALVEELTKTVCVLKGEVVNNPQEEEGWRKVGVILSDELTKTAKVTDINSIPAFLAEHLRRVFKHPKSEKNKPKLETTENRTAANTTQKVLPASLPPRSAYSFAECLQYAENLQAVGHRIHNPGGLATSLFQSGLSDTLIAEFLQPKVTLGTTNEANQSPRRLPEEKLAAETKTINELIASGMYTVTDIEENFGAYLHPQDWQEIQSRIRTDQNKAANQTHS